MQAELEIDTSALDEISRQFPYLADDVKEQMIQEATLAAAKVIEGALVLEAPVRVDAPSPRSTGLRRFAIRADIGIFPIGDGRAGWLVGPSSLTAYVVRWLEYGHYLVRGGYLSVKRGKLRGPGQRIGFVAPNPFIRRAFDSSENAAGAAAQKKLAELIQRAWGKIASKVAKVA